MTYSCLNSLLASGLDVDHGRGGRTAGGLANEGLVDVGDDTTTSDGSLDEVIKFLITTNGEEKMSGSNTLDLQVLASVAGQLKHLSGEVLHDSGRVNGSGRTNALLRVNTSLQETVNTTNRELKASSGRTRLGGALGGRGFAALATLATFAAFAAFATTSEIHFIV
jgi:hypothetical protein